MVPQDAFGSFFTESALRVIERCCHYQRHPEIALSITAGKLDSEIPTALLLMALLDEESLASASLQKLELDLNWLQSGSLGAAAAATVALWNQYHSEASAPLSYDEDIKRDINRLRTELPPAFTAVLDRAILIARRSGNLDSVSSSHILIGALELSEGAQAALKLRGIDLQRIRQELGFDSPESRERLSVEIGLTPTETEVQLSSTPSQTRSPEQSPPPAKIWRALDAIFNRCREGLRVLEDITRFLMDDGPISRELKLLRHELVLHEQQLYLLAAELPGEMRRTHILRDVSGDPGTSVTTASENERSSVRDLMTANSRRVQEAFRSLEELGKVISPVFAGSMKQLRYRVYDLEVRMQSRIRQAPSAETLIPEEFRLRLSKSHLYVLISESECSHPWKEVLEDSLKAGADIIQLREKQLDDRSLLERARYIRQQCHRHGALFILNDRPDLAILAGADGVHVGQDEIPLREVRSLVGPDLLIGISTHNLSQALEAQRDGADYLGVGPIFPSKTKSFDEFPGLRFVQEAIASITIPWFAIGGIGPEQAEILRQLGATRIAVTAAIARSADVTKATQQLRQILNHPANNR
ncbi:MAG: thiamine phosphate synthase [Planctomyces sp.]|nr:thiamine phosphate synthase [Planctomyces sp.]